MTNHDQRPRSVPIGPLALIYPLYSFQNSKRHTVAETIRGWQKSHLCWSTRQIITSCCRQSEGLKWNIVIILLCFLKEPKSQTCRYNNPFLPKLLFLSQCFIAVMESLSKTLCLGKKKKKSWKLQSIYSVSVIYTTSLMPRSLQTWDIIWMSCCIATINTNKPHTAPSLAVVWKEPVP